MLLVLCHKDTSCIFEIGHNGDEKEVKLAQASKVGYAIFFFGEEDRDTLDLSPKKITFIFFPFTRMKPPGPTFVCHDFIRTSGTIALSINNKQ